MMAREQYDSDLAYTHWWWQARAHTLDTLMSKYADPLEDPYILDIGCGVGNYLPILAEYGDVCGVDNDPNALEHCPREYAAVNGDVYNLWLQNGECDIVVALDLLEHLDSDMLACVEINRVLSRNGVFIVSVPALESLWSDHDNRLGHFRRYNKRRLSDLLTSTGFQIEEIFYGMWSIFPAAYAHRKVSNITSRIQPSNGTPEGFQMPSWANTLIKEVCVLENGLLSGIRPPFGTSLWAVAGKK